MKTNHIFETYESPSVQAVIFSAEDSVLTLGSNVGGTLEPIGDEDDYQY